MLSALMKNIEKMQATGLASEALANRKPSTSYHKPCVNIASVLNIRGLDASDYIKECQNYLQLSNSIPHVDWVDNWGSGNIYHSPKCVNGYQRSISLLSNGQAVLPYLNRLINKSTQMFKVGAYLHQYIHEKSGLEIDDFTESFRSIGQVIENYKSIG